MLFIDNKKNELTLEQKQLIYEEYFETIFKLALYLTGNRHVAEDLTHDTFVLAFEKYGQLKSISKIGAWIRAIAANLANRHYKDKKRLIFVGSESLKPAFSSTRVFSDDKIIEQDIKNSLRELSKKFQEVLVLKYFCDLEVSEIATVLNVPEGTVKSRLNRGREKMKAKIEGADEFNKNERVNGNERR